MVKEYLNGANRTAAINNDIVVVFDSFWLSRFEAKLEAVDKTSSLSRGLADCNVTIALI